MIDQPTREVVVQAIIRETPTVKRFVLAPYDGYPLAGFVPGSHITTLLHTEKGQLERHYSLCNDPLYLSTYEIAVRLTPDSKGGSRYLHEQVEVGDKLTISQPKNHFTLSQRATHHVLMAGGIGITPLYSMALALRRQGHSFELHYAARSAEECAFYDEIVSWDAPISFYFSTGTKVQRQRSEAVLEGQRVGTHLYICGPASLLTDFRAAATAHGFPEDHIHFEYFQHPNAQDNRPFLVHLKQSGRTMEIGAQESLLDGLTRHGVHVPSSCRVGGCGTCEISVCHGEVEHRDFLLSESERVTNRTIISCVSRARGDLLELDL